MADFVAVIRRAVDGLANNTPDMRAKVYDKARGAVQRQLENMKPRPPEEMLRRQMEKLEAAIRDVEAEHSEALPADDAVAAAPIVDDIPVAETARPEPHAEEPPVHAEPEHPAAVYEPQEQPVAYEAKSYEPETHEPEPYEPVEAAPVHEHVQHYEPAEAEPEPEAVEPVAEAPAYHEEPAFHEEEEAVAARAHEEQAVPHYGDWREDLPPEDPAPAVDPFVSEPAAPARAFVEQDEPDFPYPTRGEVAANRVVEVPAAGWRPEQDYAAPFAAQPQHVEEVSETPDWGWEDRRKEDDHRSDAHSGHAADTSAAWNDVPDLIPAGPAEPVHLGSKSDSVEARFHEETHVTADSVRMPSVADLPELAPAAAVAAAVSASAKADPLADYIDAKPKSEGKAAESDPWGDLEDLIGFGKDAPAAGATPRGGLHSDADAEDLMPAPARPYRVTPVRKRNYAGIILAIVGLAVLGGGGYAIWMNRDSLNDMVDGLIQSSLPSSSSGSQTAQQTPSTPAPANNTRPGQTQTPAATTPAPASQNSAANTAGAATPRPADGATAGTKFTQRLMADGTETDSGPGGSAAGMARNAEGQSVAQLNVPPSTPSAPANGAAAPAPATPGAPAPSGNAATTTAPAPSATPATTPAVAGEKMFLYEERVGQSAPTAIEGTVAWSLQREGNGNNQRQQPVIQGRISVPGRGLAALLTIKRNSDPSLPASHLIEIVFDLPPDFEGGKIDSVQRIAMKSTEQDRGNALIAVPAKITDDFHMIALNDFPDARNTNMELLRSRNWMDIPVAYRNGRRALLTLQKGTEGDRVFGDAIREWNAQPATQTGQ